VPTPETEPMVFVGLKVKPAIRAAIEEARGGRALSQFVRDALRAECRRCGVDLPEDSALPVGRLGKGGPRKSAVEKPPENRVLYDLRETGPAELNEAGKTGAGEAAVHRPFIGRKEPAAKVSSGGSPGPEGKPGLSNLIGPRKGSKRPG